VQETIESVLKQDFSNWELFVIDDGSTDGSRELVTSLLENDKRCLVLNKPSHLAKGPSASRNFGAEMAKGAYLIFLDADDILTPFCLTQRLDFIQAKPDLDFAVFPQNYFKGDFKEVMLFSKFFRDKGDYLKSFLEDIPPWCVSGPIWRKQSFLKLGGFREDYRIMEDPELHCRALLEELKFEVPESFSPDFFYRINADDKNADTSFWDNSINGRFIFYTNLLTALEEKKVLPQVKSSVSKGILNFIKGFVLSRLTGRIAEFLTFLKHIRKRKLISQSKYFLLKLYISADSYRIRGVKSLVYKLI